MIKMYIYCIMLYKLMCILNEEGYTKLLIMVSLVMQDWKEKSPLLTVYSLLYC